MGGRGSGRHWHYGAADTTDAYRCLDIRRWQRDGFLTPGRSFGWQWTWDGEQVASINVHSEVDRVTLSYRHRAGGAEWKSEEYPVRLNWTACHFGGQRPWFVCPARGCGRRVAILYGGDIFACRRCYRLAYPSQREADYDRVARRAETIRRRLGWEPGILNGEGGKPRGMHWRTFERLADEHNALVEASLTGAARRFGLVKGWLD